MADGSVTIKATLDASGVKSGVSEINSSVSSISTSGVDDLGESTETTSRKMGGLGTQTETTGKKTTGAGGETDGFSSKLASMGTAATVSGAALTAGVTQPLVNVGRTAIDSAASFEQSMNLIQQQSGASGDTMTQLGELAKQMGADTVYSTNDAADAMLNLVKAGMSPAEIQAGALNSTMVLAAAGDMDLADASTVTANAMNMFGLSAENSSEVAAALAGAANASTADVSDLSLGLSQCGAVASNAGWSIQETTGALGMFSQAGINGSDAGTSLKSMLLALESPSSTAADLMDQYGISLYNADGSMKSAGEVAQNLQDGLGGLSDEQKNAALTTIFGSDATRVATVMMNNGAAGLQTYTDAASDQAAAQDLANTKMSGMSGAIESMNGSIDNAVQALGSALAPVIETVTGAVQDLANWFAGLDPTMQTVIAVVLAIVAAIGPLLIIIGSVMGAIAAIQAVTISTTALLTGGVVVAIAAVVAALVWFFTQTDEGKAIWQGFVDFLTNAWNVISSTATTVWTAITTFLSSAWTAISTTATTVWTAISTFFSTIWNAITTVIQTALNVIQVIIMTVWSVISGIIQAAMAVIQVIFEVAWAAISAVVSVYVTAISTVIQAAMTFWQTYIQPVLDAILLAFQTAWNAISSAVSTVCDAVSSTIQSVWNGIVSFIGPILDGISSTMTSVWNAISSTVSSVVNSISSTVSSVWNGISSTLSSIINGISSTMSSVWNGISSTVSSVVNGISSTVSSVWNAIKSATSAAFDAVANAIRGPMDTAKNLVSSALDAISNLFSWAHFEFPHINMPHFSINGSFSLDPPSVPSLGIDWYAKGGVFNSASVIGIGEGRDSEAALPLNSSTFGSIAKGIVAEGGAGGGGITVSINIAKFVNQTDEDVRTLSERLGTLTASQLKAKGALA